MRYLTALLAALAALLLAGCGSSPSGGPFVQPRPTPQAVWAPTALEVQFLSGARAIARTALQDVKDERLAGWGVDNCYSVRATDAKTGKPFPRAKVLEQVRTRFLNKVTAAQAGKLADLSRDTVCREH